MITKNLICGRFNVDSKHAMKIITVIKESYPNSKFSDLTISVWISLLEDADFDETMTTLVNYVKKNKFPPAIGDIYIKDTKNAHDEYEEYKERERAKVQKELDDPVLREKRKKAEERMKAIMMKLQLEIGDDEDDI